MRVTIANPDSLFDKFIAQNALCLRAAACAVGVYYLLWLLVRLLIASVKS